MKLLSLPILFVLSGLFWASASSDDASPQSGPTRRSTVVPAEIQPLNSLIGNWRGIGQPRRGSRQGAWQETTACRWDFSGKRPAVQLETKQGRQFQTLRLEVMPDGQRLQLTVVCDGQPTRKYFAPVPQKWPTRLRLESVSADDGTQDRCTLEQLSDIRLTLLFEHKRSSTASYRRVAGVGYTRSGHRLAEPGGNQRECIVTGGKGTIPVVYEGKTWYVCCQGCRQAFDDDPAGIIAAWQEEQQEKKKQSESPTR